MSRGVLPIMVSMSCGVCITVYTYSTLLGVSTTDQRVSVPVSRSVLQAKVSVSPGLIQAIVSVLRDVTYQVVSVTWCVIG